MAVELAPQLHSPESSARLADESVDYQLDMITDPDDPIIAAELAKEFDFDESSDDSSFTYLYKDGEIYSVYTDPNTGEKSLIANSDSLDGAMLASHANALQSLRDGSTMHEAEGVMIGQDEKSATYVVQTYERVDDFHVKISSRVESAPKEPSRPNLDDRDFSMDGAPASAENFDALMNDFSDFAPAELHDTAIVPKPATAEPAPMQAFFAPDKPKPQAPAPAESKPQAWWESPKPAEPPQQKPVESLLQTFIQPEITPEPKPSPDSEAPSQAKQESAPATPEKPAEVAESSELPEAEVAEQAEGADQEPEPEDTPGGGGEQVTIEAVQEPAASEQADDAQSETLAPEANIAATPEASVETVIEATADPAVESASERAIDSVATEIVTIVATEQPRVEVAADIALDQSVAEVAPAAAVEEPAETTGAVAQVRVETATQVTAEVPPAVQVSEVSIPTTIEQNAPIALSEVSNEPILATVVETAPAPIAEAAPAMTQDPMEHTQAARTVEIRTEASEADMPAANVSAEHVRITVDAVQATKSFEVPHVDAVEQTAPLVRTEPASKLVTPRRTEATPNLDQQPVEVSQSAQPIETKAKQAETVMLAAQAPAEIEMPVHVSPVIAEAKVETSQPQEQRIEPVAETTATAQIREQAPARIAETPLQAKDESLVVESATAETAGAAPIVVEASTISSELPEVPYENVVSKVAEESPAPLVVEFDQPAEAAARTVKPSRQAQTPAARRSYDELVAQSPSPVQETPQISAESQPVNDLERLLRKPAPSPFWALPNDSATDVDDDAQDITVSFDSDEEPRRKGRAAAKTRSTVV